ncbi:MAG: dTDP-4-dehydrorhamnose reductase [Candidatus Berkelbacteria bacterium]|nr:dTDP-4-dehydrorhamnose reductase [Candidatus Berkelbacteria bacterium]
MKLNHKQQATNHKLPTILVTGAKGQLGKKIIELITPISKLVLTDSDDMDITNAEIVEKTFTKVKPDFVIHAAAYTQVDKAEENADFCTKINVEGTRNIANATVKHEATLVYISTDYVFDGLKNTPYSEEDIPNPLSIYGETKYEGELIVAETCPKHYILRISWLFGELPEGHPGTNFVETMLRLAKERDELTIVSDQIGSPTYTGDLVEIISRFVSSQQSAVDDDRKPVPHGLYHFSGSGAASWYDFAVEIFKQTKTKINVKAITSDQYPQKANRPTYSYLDKSKIESALEMKVRPWQEMLKSYLEKR